MFITPIKNLHEQKVFISTFYICAYNFVNLQAIIKKLSQMPYLFQFQSTVLENSKKWRSKFNNCFNFKDRMMPFSLLVSAINSLKFVGDEITISSFSPVD